MLDDLRIDRSKAPPRKAPVMALAAAILMAAAAGGAVWALNRPKAPEVRTAAVRELRAGGDRTLLNATGYVTARREATVSSKVTGKVMEVLVEEGMTVTADQVLARIDASNVETGLRLAEAQAESLREALNETRANIELADRELVRTRDSVAQDLVNRAELDRAEAESKALKARLERQAADVSVAEREVDVWRQQLDDTIIRAPFSGVVTAKNAQPGEMISLMSSGGFARTGICTIVDMDSLEIEVDVSESYINRIQSEQPVTATLDSYPEWRIPAKVITIIPTADRQKATVKVRVGFDALDPRILPDMSVKVAFLSAEEPAAERRTLVVPKSAVVQIDGKDVVWVVKDGKAERRAVTVGGVTGDDAAIDAGVSSGERVVIEGAEQLADGAGVTETTE